MSFSDIFIKFYNPSFISLSSEMSYSDARELTRLVLLLMRKLTQQCALRHFVIFLLHCQTLPWTGRTTPSGGPVRTSGWTRPGGHWTSTTSTRTPSSTSHQCTKHSGKPERDREHSIVLLEININYQLHTPPAAGTFRVKRVKLFNFAH